MTNFQFQCRDLSYIECIKWSTDLWAAVSAAAQRYACFFHCDIRDQRTKLHKKVIRYFDAQKLSSDVIP